MTQKLIEDILKSGIVFISPEYKDGIGDTTLIRTENDEVLVEKNIKTIISNIAKYLFLDLDESKNYYKELLNKGRNLPLVLNANNILFCFKTRVPIGKNDGAMSYINPKYIEGYDYGILELSTGDTIHSLTSEKTIKNNLKEYRHILNDLEIRV